MNKLHSTYATTSQLGGDFEGSFPYGHEKWLENRLVCILISVLLFICQHFLVNKHLSHCLNTSIRWQYGTFINNILNQN